MDVSAKWLAKPKRLIMAGALAGGAVFAAFGGSGMGLPAAHAACDPYSHTFDNNDNMFQDQNDRRASVSMQGGLDDAELDNCNDTGFGGAAGDQIHGANGDDSVYGESGHDNSNQHGTYGAATLFGGSADDFVDGADGIDDLDDSQAGSDADELRGGSEDDSLDDRDGDGNDVLRGQGGNDACQDDSGDDTIC